MQGFLVLCFLAAQHMLFSGSLFLTFMFLLPTVVDTAQRFQGVLRVIIARLPFSFRMHFINALPVTHREGKLVELTR